MAVPSASEVGSRAYGDEYRRPVPPQWVTSTTAPSSRAGNADARSMQELATGGGPAGQGRRAGWVNY